MDWWAVVTYVSFTLAVLYLVVSVPVPGTDVFPEICAFQADTCSVLGTCNIAPSCSFTGGGATGGAQTFTHVGVSEAVLVVPSHWTDIT